MPHVAGLGSARRQAFFHGVACARPPTSSMAPRQAEGRLAQLGTLLRRDLLLQASPSRLSCVRFGGRSSAGRALDCGSSCRGFEPRRSPPFCRALLVPAPRRDGRVGPLVFASATVIGAILRDPHDHARLPVRSAGPARRAIAVAHSSAPHETARQMPIAPLMRERQTTLPYPVQERRPRCRHATLPFPLVRLRRHGLDREGYARAVAAHPLPRRKEVVADALPSVIIVDELRPQAVASEAS
jgi:hypothetical protein